MFIGAFELGILYKSLNDWLYLFSSRKYGLKTNNKKVNQVSG